MSTFLRSIIPASSLPLPVIVPVFKVPTFMSERLSFHTSRCLFTHLPPLFLLLSLLCLEVASFLGAPCCATPEAVVGNPGRDRSGMDLSTICICIIWQKMFYAGCPSCRNLLYLSGFWTGIKKHRNVSPMAGLYKNYHFLQIKNVDQRLLFKL